MSEWTGRQNEPDPRTHRCAKTTLHEGTGSGGCEALHGRAAKGHESKEGGNARGRPCEWCAKLNRALIRETSRAGGR